MDKIDSYIGFAIKSGKIIYGIDNLKIYRKKIHLILVCPTASENLKKEGAYFSEKRGIPLIEFDRPLENITHKTNCKLAAITDFNLAQAALGSIRR